MATPAQQQQQQPQPQLSAVVTRQQKRKRGAEEAGGGTAAAAAAADQPNTLGAAAAGSAAATATVAAAVPASVTLAPAAADGTAAVVPRRRAQQLQAAAVPVLQALHTFRKVLLRPDRLQQFCKCEDSEAAGRAELLQTALQQVGEWSGVRLSGVTCLELVPDAAAPHGLTLRAPMERLASQLLHSLLPVLVAAGRGRGGNSQLPAVLDPQGSSETLLRCCPHAGGNPSCLARHVEGQPGLVSSAKQTESIQQPSSTGLADAHLAWSRFAMLAAQLRPCRPHALLTSWPPCLLATTLSVPAAVRGWRPRPTPVLQDSLQRVRPPEPRRGALSCDSPCCAVLCCAMLSACCAMLCRAAGMLAAAPCCGLCM